MDLKSIVEMSNGAIIERVDYVVPQIIDNILDVNTNPIKKRTLTIVLDFIADVRRENIEVLCTVKPPKLEATAPISTSLYIMNGEIGNRRIVELAKQAPGQLDMLGGEQPEPTELRIIGG